MVESLFSTLTGEMSACCKNSFEISNTWISFRKVTLLENSRDPLLIVASGLQSAVCNSTKQISNQIY